jgi:guanylate kinase
MRIGAKKAVSLYPLPFILYPSSPYVLSCMRMIMIISARLVILSAPSGAGKSTICRLLLERNPDFRVSISATTRAPRKTEKDGVHYFFLSEEEFFRKVKNDEFLEHEEVHGNYYGTLKSSVNALMDKGYTVLFDIDVNGALQIKKQHPDAMLVFIRPPSLEELKRRLRNRQTDDEAEIQHRLERLPLEYAKAALFDYDIVNDDLIATVDQIEQLIRKHQHQRANVPH